MIRISMGRTVMTVLAIAVLLAGCGPSTPEEFVASAKQELAKNDRASALIHLRNALQKNPDLAEARYLLGKALFENGEPIAAERELRKALELKFPEDQVIPTLARAMLALGQFKLLIDEFGSSDMGSPAGTADLQTTVGLALLGQGNVAAAEAAFAAALAAQPEYARAILGEARVKAVAGDLKAALDLADKALAKAPDLAEGWQFKGIVLVAQNQPDEALAAYRKAVEINRNDIAAHTAIVWMLMQQGKTDEASAQLDAMKQVAPRHPQTQLLRGRLAYMQKDYAAASEAIQQHLKSVPNSLPGLLVGASIDMQLKAYAQAEAKLVKVLGAAPRNRMATRLLISTYVSSGQPAKALALVKPILQAIEKDSDMLAMAGSVFMQNGDVAEGIAYFEKAATLDPQSARKRTAVALAHLAKGETDRALAELEEAAAADTETHADMALIATYLRQRQFEKALAAIDVLEKKQPDSPVPSNLRGAALMGKGDAAGARRSFERALEHDPAFFAAAANLARMDLAERKPDQAKERYEAVLAKDPKNTSALLALAQLRAGAGGSTEEVAAMIAKAVAANPTDEASRLALVDHYLRNKNAGKAVTAAREAQEALPDRPQIVDALGRAHRAAGDEHQAMAAYRKLAELTSGSPLPYVRMADLQIASKNEDKALEFLRQALTLKPDLVEAQRAVIALDLKAGRLQQAVAVARDVQKQRPKQSVGFIFEGDIYASKKAWNEAVAAYRAGLKQVGTVDLATKLHAVLRASGNLSEADKFAASWIQEHPKDGEFRFHLAQSAMRRNDYAASAQQYRALIEVRPNDAMALNNLAWALGQLKDPQALEYAEKAYELAPNSPHVADTLGVLLVEKGETGRGLELLQKASELAPKSAPIRLHLAKALLKAGQKDAAKKQLETLEKLGDKYPAQAEVARLMKDL